MIAIALWLALAGPATTPTNDAELRLSACSRKDAAQEALDAALVRKAQSLLASPSEALTGLRAELETLLTRHQDRPRAELCAGVVFVNSGDPDDATYLQADMVGSVTKATASTYRFEVVRDYVVDAALIVAAIAWDQGDQAKAARWLAFSARIAPHDPAVRALQALSPEAASPARAVDALRGRLAP